MVRFFVRNVKSRSNIYFRLRLAYSFAVSINGIFMIKSSLHMILLMVMLASLVGQSMASGTRSCAHMASSESAAADLANASHHDSMAYHEHMKTMNSESEVDLDKQVSPEKLDCCEDCQCQMNVCSTLACVSTGDSIDANLIRDSRILLNLVKAPIIEKNQVYRPPIFA